MFVSVQINSILKIKYFNIAFHIDIFFFLEMPRVSPGYFQYACALGISREANCNFPQYDFF